MSTKEVYDDTYIRERLTKIEDELNLDTWQGTTQGPTRYQLGSRWYPPSTIESLREENKSLELALKALEWRIRALEKEVNDE